MVGTGRFELPTPRTPSESSTRRSHVPTEGNRSISGGVKQYDFTPVSGARRAASGDFMFRFGLVRLFPAQQLEPRPTPTAVSRSAHVAMANYPACAGTEPCPDQHQSDC